MPGVSSSESALPPRLVWPGALAVIALGALVLRLLHVAHMQSTPMTAVLVGDGRMYDTWARQIATGHWLGSEVFYQSPLYPYVLAAAYRLIGDQVLVIRIVQAVLGACSCALLGLAGRRFFSATAGLVAAAMLAVYAPAIFFDGLVQKSSLDLFLATLLLACLGEFSAAGQRRWLVGAGLALGLFALNRENARVLYPVIAAWLLAGFRTTLVRTRLVQVGIVTAAVAVVLVPVGVRNYVVGGEFLVSTSQMGSNFYIGNHSGATGFYEPLVADRGDAAYEREDARRLAVAATGRDLSPGQVSDYWLGRAFDHIRTDPPAWARLIAKKLLLTLNATEASDTESIEAYSEYSAVLRAVLWFDFGIVLALSVLGAWRTRADWRQLALLYGMIGALVASVALFFVFARYRYPLVPLLMLFAAVAVCPNPGAVGGWRRQWVPGLALALVFGIGSHVDLSAGKDATYWSIGAELLSAGRPADAIPMIERTLKATPSYAPAHLGLGLALGQMGERQKAIEQFTTALRLRPDFADAHGALGIALQEMDRPDEAMPHFVEAVRLKPDDAQNQWNLGLALARAGRSDEAIAAYQASVRLDPNNPRAHTNLAGLLLRDGRTVEAIPHLEASVRLQPANGQTRLSLGIALKAAGNDRAAVAQLREAVRLQPDLVEARLSLGALLADAGQVQEGLAELRQAAQLEPASVDPFYLQALVYAHGKRCAEAMAPLQQALANARAAGRADSIAQIESMLRTCRAEAAAR
jgi:tetratricopeptide (TPR) repeat protein